MARNSAAILWLSKIDQDDISSVGKKAVTFGNLARAGFPIPEGFVITSAAYTEFLSHQHLRETISQLLSTVAFERPESVMQVSELIKKQIKEAPFPKELLHEIDEAYQQLGGVLHHVPVAIRSSQIADDLLTPSFVGEAETVLNIQGEANLILHLRQMWSSLFSPQALLSRHEQHVDHFKFSTAVLVQKMVHAEQSGNLFTIDPTTQDKKVLIIEATAGGEMGEVVPEQYTITKKDLQVKAKHGSEKPILSENHIMQLAVLGKRLSTEVYFPQEIEWAIEKRNLFILSVNNLATPMQKAEPTPSAKLPLIGKGIAASAGMQTSHVRVVKTVKELSKLLPGEILVLPTLNDQFLAALTQIKKAGAIVSDTGGKTDHLTHVFRELGIPAVMGTGNATNVLHTGQVVTVNGSTGEVSKGSTTNAAQTTATKIYINLAQAAYADIAVDSGADGVGLLCPDCLMADLGMYRQATVSAEKRHEYAKVLGEHLVEVCTIFMPHPVMYELKYHDQEFFSVEVAALKQIREQKVTNLGVVLSAIRTLDDLHAAKKHLSDAGLSRSHGFKLWLMVETPAQVVMLEKFISAGIDGVTIGSQTLTMLMLGTDDEKVDERNPAVLWAIEQVIRAANKHHIASSFSGQAASLYPSLLNKLVEWGISSISVSPSVVETVREAVAKAERELVENRSPKKK